MQDGEAGWHVVTKTWHFAKSCTSASVESYCWSATSCTPAPEPNDYNTATSLSSSVILCSTPLSSSEPGGDHGESDPQVASKGVRDLVVSSSCQQS